MTKKPRYLALDVFRGATVCLMITVNSPGEWGVQYGPLQHASWHGFTLTDFVFPAFLFAVGNAMAFVMEKFHSQPDAHFWKKVIKRTVLIFLIGFLLNWFPFYDLNEGSFVSITSVRTLGVLQRIALCYGFAMILVHYASRQWVMIVSGVLLLGYWAVLYLFGDPADPYGLSGFAGNYLDLALIGETRLYQGEGVPFDPEGLLSTLPAIVNVIIGYFSGRYIIQNGHTFETLAKLFLAGVVLVFAALWWDWFFPINKKIWTSSFVLLTSGINILTLAIMVFAIEMKQWRWTYFFEVFGRNPLFIYALSWVLMTVFYMIPTGGTNLKVFLYESFKLAVSPAHASFLFAILFMLINWLVGYGLDKRGIYIKV